MLDPPYYTVPHWKALSSGKYKLGGPSFGSTLKICQGIMKSANLLHKRGIFYSQSIRTVSHLQLKGQDGTFFVKYTNECYAVC